MSEQTTDDGILKLRWKVVFPVVGFLLLVSNMFTRYISVLNENTDKIDYNLEANQRRIKNAINILKLENEIVHLKDELKKCN